MSSSTLPPLPHDLVERGHRFVEKIGEGGMAEVWLAEDRTLHRFVAYKRIHESLAQNKHHEIKFYGEAQVAAQLDHPHIVPVYRFERSKNGSLAYSMKHIQGVTLSLYLEHCRHQEEKNQIDAKHQLTSRLEILVKIGDAIDYAHSRGVLHRDLKPDNIMIGDFGEVYVMDWGIACPIPTPEEQCVFIEGDPEWAGHARWVSRTAVGTPRYMSPEQARNQSNLDGRSDEYSLGLILFESVCLFPAYSGESETRIQIQQQHASRAEISHALGKKISPSLRAIIEKATASDREQRYPSVGEFTEDLRRFLRGDPVFAKNDTLVQAFFRWIRKHSEMATLIATLWIGFLAFIALGTASVSIYQRLQNASHEQVLTAEVTHVGQRAAKLQNELTRLAGIAESIASSTREALSHSEGRAITVTPSSLFSKIPLNPSDFENSARYEEWISLTTPASNHTNGLVTRLATFGPGLERALLQSKGAREVRSPTSKIDRILREIGSPISRIHIGLFDGGYLAYPGREGIPPDFDPRTRPWYRLGQNHSQWGVPYVDNGKLGIVLPYATPLFDYSDPPRLLGVVAIELPFDHLIEEHLLDASLPAQAETFIVDHDGKIIVRSSEFGKDVTGTPLRNRTLRTPLFPKPEVVNALNSERSVRLELYSSADRLWETFIIEPIRDSNWFLVVQAPSKAWEKRISLNLTGEKPSK